MNYLVSEKYCFDNNWRFHKGDISVRRPVKAGAAGGVTDNTDLKQGEWLHIAFHDENSHFTEADHDWCDVDIPHDWLVEENCINDSSLGSRPASNGYRRTGQGCYRKVFTIPKEDEGKKITIVFDGIMRSSEIWINGHYLGHHFSGYTGFEYDISDHLRYEEGTSNVIFIRVDVSEHEGWWYEGAGIYRHIWLIKSERTYISRNGVYIKTNEVKDEKAFLSISIDVKNEISRNHNIQIFSYFYSGDRLIRTEEYSSAVRSHSDLTLEFSSVIPDPLLWSPEEPNLYKMVTEMYIDNSLADIHTCTFGIRTILFTSDEGFFLNGQPYVIKGTCIHQDFAGAGIALPDKLINYKIDLLKEMGSNAVRTAHHPAASELLDYCDRAGMLVMEENRRLDSSPEGLEDLKFMLYRDRNHPSIIIWSMENEELLEGTSEGRRILSKLCEITRNIDPSRPITACMNHGWNDNCYTDSLDITGYNYGQRNDQYLLDHIKYPSRKMIASESTCCPVTRGIYADDFVRGYCNSYGTTLPEWGCSHEKSWKDVADNSFLTGIFVWSGFDYRGEPTPFEWPCVVSHFGIMDLCGFPKDPYYFYKSAWTSDPAVHILPHWNWESSNDSSIRVRTYSNCDEVELILNGKRLGRRKSSVTEPLDSLIEYQRGELCAVGYIDGRAAAHHRVVTSGPPALIEARTEHPMISADKNDVSVVRVSVLDRSGIPVPDADDYIYFRVEGPGKIIGTGNGDPSDHSSEKIASRRAFNGKCMVLIRSCGVAGTIVLYCTSARLKESILKISVTNPD